MTTYVSALDFPFVLEFPTDDVRDVVPIVHSWMDNGRTVDMAINTTDGQPAVRVMVNFALVRTLMLGAVDPFDDDDRMRLPLSQAEFERLLS